MSHMLTGDAETQIPWEADIASHRKTERRETMKEFRKLKSLKFLYEINSEGILRNVKSKKVIKGYRESNGYTRVKLESKSLGGIVRTSIHQLVAEAFVPNPMGLPEVNHKNSDRSDNRAENLEWVSHSQNMKHAYHDGAYSDGVKKGLAVHWEGSKRKVTNGEKTFESLSDAGEWLASLGKAKNASSGRSGIYAVCNGKRKSFGGFNWSYV